MASIVDVTSWEDYALRAISRNHLPQWCRCNQHLLTVQSQAVQAEAARLEAQLEVLQQLRSCCCQSFLVGFKSLMDTASRKAPHALGAAGHPTLRHHQLAASAG